MNQQQDNPLMPLYITYIDSKLNKDVCLGPYLSDINLVKLLKIISDLPVCAIRIRVIMDRKDINFGGEGYVNVHFRNDKGNK